MKSIFGLNENVVAALAYIPGFGVVVSIITLIMEQTNKFVRFHAMQSIVYNLFLFAIGFVMNIIGIIPLLGGLVNWVYGMLVFVATIYLIFQALSSKTFKIPYIGDAVWRQVDR